MKQALLIVDIQKDYFPGGKMELVGADEAGQKARELLTVFRNRQWPVIHIQHVSIHPGATFFLPETAGVQIHDLVQPLENETVIQKYLPNSFNQTSLLNHLKQLDISRLVITGMMTHMCIDATTRAAFDAGFKCLLAHDACATRALRFGDLTVPAEYVQASFMAALNGIYAQVLSTDQLCASF